MLHLIRSEWLKLAKRPLTWVLLVVFLLLMVVQYLQFFFIVTVGGQLLDPVQVDDVRRRLSFPGAFGAVFGHVNGLGGIFAVVLAAGMIGGDYTWGTLRTYLPRHPNRTRYLLAKLMTLLLALLLGMVITTVVGALSAVAFGALVGGAGLPSLASVAQLPVAMLRALIVLLPYVLITVAAAVYGRSLVFGLVAGMLFQFVDIAFGAVATFAELGGMWQLFYQLMVQANITTLTNINSMAFGLDPGAINQRFNPALMPSQPQAIVVIAVYCAVFLVLALRWFNRRDIGGAA